MATPVESSSGAACSFLGLSSSNKVDSNLQNVDELLADEMRGLSLQERYRMDMDVKGKNLLSAIEPAELVKMGLKAMDKELQTMTKRTFYEKALRLNSAMVTSRDFRLSFCRAESFDHVAAASRMENRLQLLYENFGDQGLLRPIHLTDLDKAERDLLKAGSTQLLPCRDKAGRCIMSRLGDFGTAKHTLRHKLRATLYMTQVIAEDEETAKQGLVILFWNLQEGDNNLSHISALRKAAACSPFRISAFHFCLNKDQRPAAIVIRTILLACPEYRSRCRVHIGTTSVTGFSHQSHIVDAVSQIIFRLSINQLITTGSVTECQYALLAYGIPSEFAPITNTGNIKTQNHNKWIAYREAKENALRRGIPFDGIDFPSVTDVLAGKGPHVLGHPGNIAFRRIIEARFEEHRDAAVIERKTAITWEVLLEIQRRGGRFLVKGKDKGWWTVADEDAAREKVSVAFRDMLKSTANREKLLSRKRMDDARSSISEGNKAQKRS